MSITDVGIRRSGFLLIAFVCCLILVRLVIAGEAKTGGTPAAKTPKLAAAQNSKDVTHIDIARAAVPAGQTSPSAPDHITIASSRLPVSSAPAVARLDAPSTAGSNSGDQRAADANHADSNADGVGAALGGPGFPPAGTDLSPTTGIFHVDLSGIGPVETSVSGTTLLQWQNPQTDPTGQRTVQTEMLSMNLTGSSSSLGSLTVRAGADNGLPPSLGHVTPIDPFSDFPAHAFFDVFFEVVVNGSTTLRNSEPLKMEADITEIPPRSIGLRNASPVLITDIVNQSQVSVLRTAQHWMCPPPFPPAGVPCPVPCNRSPFPVCSPGDCPGTCVGSTVACHANADCPAGATCVGVKQCVPNNSNDTCECKPGFPPIGTDLSPTTGILRVDVTGLGTVDTSVAGNTLLRWQNPVTGPGGRRTVQTEMLSLDLTGSDPTIGSLHVRAGSSNGLPPTLGSVTAINPGADFPANSFFDVFFDIEVNGTTHLRNDQPLRMQADITEIPPRSIGLRNAAPVQIRDLAGPGQISTIQTAQHWMCPPPFPPPGVPCPVPCDRSPYPVCKPGTCPTATQQCKALSPFFAQDGLQGKCVCVEGFPPAGTDSSPTVGTFQVDLASLGPVQTTVTGQTLLQWQNPVTGPGGQRTVQTELLALDLTGSDPSIGNLTVHAGSLLGLPPSTGSVVPVAPGSDFPANAFFDVFFEVTVNGSTTLRNDQPLVMRAPITEIPPRSIGLQNAAPVQLRDLANPAQINTIQTAQHWMCPPPFPPPGVPCPVPCDRNPFPVCKLGTCPADATGALLKCMPDRTTQACRCAKPSFPPHGADLSPTTGLFRVAIAGVGVADAQVSGQVLLRWQDPVTGPGGQSTVQTEMLSLDLTGSSPTLGTVHVKGGSVLGLPASVGTVTAQQPGSDFPADSFFDVFFDVEVAGTHLVNDQPLRMQAEITEIPPRSISLRNAAPVPLRNLSNPSQINSIQTAAHWMCPPPYLQPGVPCPVACNATPQPLCSFGACPNGLVCTANAAGACGCIAPLAAVSGEASPRTSAVPLRLGKAAGGQLTLTWSASCLSADTDYGIYEGSVPNYYSHGALVCSTGGATTRTITPGAGNRYYLVVPHQASVEGSYGARKSGVQRPQGAPACLPQSAGTCP